MKVLHAGVMEWCRPERRQAEKLSDSNASNSVGKEKHIRREIGRRLCFDGIGGGRCGGSGAILHNALIGQ